MLMLVLMLMLMLMSKACIKPFSHSHFSPHRPAAWGECDAQ